MPHIVVICCVRLKSILEEERVVHFVGFFLRIDILPDRSGIAQYILYLDILNHVIKSAISLVCGGIEVLADLVRINVVIHVIKAISRFLVRRAAVIVESSISRRVTLTLRSLTGEDHCEDLMRLVE